MLTRREVVDFAFLLLAYEDRFDLVEPFLDRLHRERFDDEMRPWVGWDEENQRTNHHYMPFNDSRLVIYHFGPDLDDSTPEQQEDFRNELRARVKRLAAMSRTFLNGIKLIIFLMV
jgi:hypothetical protein